MIPKSKLAILIGSLKPKGKEEGEGEDKYEEGMDGHSPELKKKVDEVADHLLKAVRDEDREALCEVLLDFLDVIQEEDKKQDEGEEEESEEEDEGED